MKNNIKLCIIVCKWTNHKTFSYKKHWIYASSVWSSLRWHRKLFRFYVGSHSFSVHTAIAKSVMWNDVLTQLTFWCVCHVHACLAAHRSKTYMLPKYFPFVCQNFKHWFCPTYSIAMMPNISIYSCHLQISLYSLWSFLKSVNIDIRNLDYVVFDTRDFRWSHINKSIEFSRLEKLSNPGIQI